MTSLFIFLVLIVAGFTFGKLAERRHLASLESREAENGFFLVTQLKTFPNLVSGSQAPQIVIAETVVASDYF